MLEDHELQQVLLEQEVLVTAAMLWGLGWLRKKKKEAHNGICRECARPWAKTGAHFLAR